MELENEENVKHRNTPKDLFDAWAIQGKDEEFAYGNSTCKQFIKELLPFPSVPFSYLELGCSNGWAVRMVCESHRDRCVKAVGVDISPRMIWKAQNLWAVPQQASFIASNLLEYAVPEDTGFDIVFSFAVIYYIIPMEKLKEKIREWVKPGGLFVAGTDYYQENPRCHGWSSMMDIDMDLRPAEQWKKLFEETFQLKNVTQLVLDYPDMSDDEKGTLFTMGYV